MEFSDRLRYDQALQRLRLVRQFNYFHDTILNSFPGRNQLINDAKYVLSSNFPLSLSMKFFCQNLIWNYEDIDKQVLEQALERHEALKVETKLLFEFDYSSPIERIMLIRHFRCFFELATQECFRLHRLICNVKTLLNNNYPFSYDMQHFCRKVLRKYQECEELPPLFVIVRGDSAEMKAKMLSQFKHLLPDDTLKIVMQFSNYKAYAKSNPFLRSMIMRNALISTTMSEDVHFREFSMQILQEFKQYEMSLDPNILMKELRRSLLLL
ncbi:hypothetical protein WA026_008890 [Henosepilachna vigintioctopunctata]|uniref:Uncharacterized protein n=1 Tax=Henosepilachna vigintioctopunctata TaxID=420089 RepID=A0AAW1V4S7_9CUCU